MNFKKYLGIFLSVFVLLLLLTFPPGIAHAQSSDFTNINANLPGVHYVSTAWGDYDNDGDLDLLLEGQLENSTTQISRVYRNDGNGVFTDINAGLISVYSIGSNTVSWGDYDNDGDLDILLTGQTTSLIISKIYRNDGSDVFTDINAALTGVSGGSTDWGDYDNDGDLDILMTGWAGSEMVSKVYRNDGGGTFTDVNAGLLGVEGSSAKWGDYDNDNDLDILLTGNGCFDACAPGDTTKVYRNDSGSFTDINAVLTAVKWGDADWGDYDNDGDLDIVLTGCTLILVAYCDGGSTSKVYRNDGNGVFTDVNAALTALTYSKSAWGDYDNDGDLDILLTGCQLASCSPSTSFSQVYSNNSGTFINTNATLTGLSGDASWGDYDNDGDLDILITGSKSAPQLPTDFTQIYRNDILTANTVSSAPTGLEVSGSGVDVTLSWNAANDTQTPANGLTYNLRVGTAPGGAQILTPMSLSGSGYHQVPQMGNVQNGTTAILKNLPNGTYYWSVQAVDTAFAGSSFAVEGTFSVPFNNPPTVGVITAPMDPQLVNTTINANVSFTDQDSADTHTAVWDWGDNSTSAGTVTESNGSGTVSGTHTYTIPGVYEVNLTVTDNGNLSDQPDNPFRYIVVYDNAASGGFVTGAGTINSLEGAYVLQPSLTGIARFGFVSKYQPGASIPTGDTQFRFQAAGFTFSSTSYQWLVVAGAQAKFKGEGTVSGSTHNYGFQLSATDGAINGGGGTDKFRIKIWDKNNNDSLVYDNNLGAGDNADPTTQITGGNIVIH